MLGSRDDSSFDIPTEQLSFQRSQSYCICFVDIIGSTRVSVELSDPRKIRSYYSIFLNAVVTLSESFGAKLVKNVGDSIIFYFPATTDSTNRSAFKDVLECRAEIIAGRDAVNTKLRSEDIEQSIDFRISADYGAVEVARSISSRNENLFGPTMNLCAKINSKAGTNGIVVGGDLCHILRTLSLDTDYKFKEIGGYSADKKHQYSVYTVTRNATTDNDATTNLFESQAL